MLLLQSNRAAASCDRLTRRDFLRAGALSAGAVGLSLAHPAFANGGPGRDVHCILLFLVGGPSQLDTWDPKPDAPAEVRGPFGAIQTRVPGLHVGEHFPRLAARADRVALIRSVHHDEAPIHETGQQLMQTGHLFRGGEEYPHYGAVLSQRKGRRTEHLPPFVVLPGQIGNTGVGVSHGQGAGRLGAVHEPFVVRGLDPSRLPQSDALREAVDAVQHQFDTVADVQPTSVRDAYAGLFSEKAKAAFDVERESIGLRDRYGRNTFGQSCLLARRLVEQGVRLVTVNMFDTVFNRVTWDCHADGGALPSTLDDYRDTLCPTFDRAYVALLDDLEERGMLDTTLVLAMGEFGRTPHLNPRGGRDHWPGCWTVLFAGAGVRGGQVIGSSDAHAAEPADRPVTPAEVAASVYHGLGIDAGAGSEPLVDAGPVMELFR